MSASPITRALRWLASFAHPVVIERRSSAHHPVLEVTLVRGRKILDGANVNYSFGGLHEVFVETFAALGLARRDVRSPLVLGMGAGSVVRILRRDYGIEAPIVAVELDPLVVELAREHFEFGELADVEVVIDDARAYLERACSTFDLVVVDVFHEATVPAALRTREALERLRSAVAPGGLLVFNQVATSPRLRADSEALLALARSVMPGATTFETHGNLLVAWENARVLPSRAT